MSHVTAAAVHSVGQMGTMNNIWSLSEHTFSLLWQRLLFVSMVVPSKAVFFDGA